MSYEEGLWLWALWVSELSERLRLGYKNFKLEVLRFGTLRLMNRGIRLMIQGTMSQWGRLTMWGIKNNCLRYYELVWKT